jgi:hypothetical protein
MSLDKLEMSQFKSHRVPTTAGSLKAGGGHQSLLLDDQIIGGGPQNASVYSNVPGYVR